MANKTLSMHKIRQILLFLDRGFSQRTIEKETGVNRRTISSYLHRFNESGFSFSDLLLFQYHELEAYLTFDKAPKAPARHEEFQARIPYMLEELKKVGVTRYLLWQEYMEEYANGFGFSRFCELLQEYIRIKQVSMHFEHEPGPCSSG